LRTRIEKRSEVSRGGDRVALSGVGKKEGRGGRGRFAREVKRGAREKKGGDEGAGHNPCLSEGGKRGSVAHSAEKGMEKGGGRLQRSSSGIIFNVRGKKKKKRRGKEKRFSS